MLHTSSACCACAMPVQGRERGLQDITPLERHCSWSQSCTGYLCAPCWMSRKMNVRSTVHNGPATNQQEAALPWQSGIVLLLVPNMVPSTTLSEQVLVFVPFYIVEGGVGMYVCTLKKNSWYCSLSVSFLPPIPLHLCPLRLLPSSSLPLFVLFSSHPCFLLHHSGLETERERKSVELGAFSPFFFLISTGIQVQQL